MDLVVPVKRLVAAKTRLRGAAAAGDAGRARPARARPHPRHGGRGPHGPPGAHGAGGHRGPRGRGHADGVGHRGGRRPAGRAERRLRPRRRASCASAIRTPRWARCQADLPALRPAELDAAIAAALRHPGAGVHGRRRGHRHDVPAGRGRCRARPAVRGRIGGARTARRGRCALDGAWPSLRCDVDTPADLTAALAPRTWGRTRGPPSPVCDFTQLSRATDGRTDVRVGQNHRRG